MKAIIIEDEIVASQNLQRLIQKIDNTIEITAFLHSVEESIEWLSEQPVPDLIFLDIHLSDGSAFSIFDKIQINSPIIFTTAYDQYALNAFEVNSIDYLLKPINPKELERAITKYKNLKANSGFNNETLADFISGFKNKENNFKSRFLLPYKDKFLSIETADIAYIYSENKMAKIVTLKDQGYQMNTSLDEISKQLDPSSFFRANRQFIISRKAVKDIFTWFDSKLSVTLSVSIPEKIIISRAKVQEFKTWFTT